MSDFNGGTNLTNGLSTEHQFLCWKANPRLLVADAVDKWHLAPTKCCSREMRQLEGHDCSTFVIAGLIESHLKKKCTCRIRQASRLCLSAKELMFYGESIFEICSSIEIWQIQTKILIEMTDLDHENDNLKHFFDKNWNLQNNPWKCKSNSF